MFDDSDLMLELDKISFFVFAEVYPIVERVLFLGQGVFFAQEGFDPLAIA